MRVIADLCLIPIGIGVSVSKEIAACERVLAEAGLKTKLHAYGTNIEGEWDEVFAAIKRCHEVVHAMGAPRISSSLRFGTRVPRRTDDKVQSVARNSIRQTPAHVGLRYSMCVAFADRHRRSVIIDSTPAEAKAMFAGGKTTRAGANHPACGSSWSARSRWKKSVCGLVAMPTAPALSSMVLSYFSASQHGPTRRIAADAVPHRAL
jgi:uncharacterized protein (TIGR00106 family)